MQEIKLDYIIVGQGLAGTWLSYELLNRDQKILVINDDKADTSSKKAAGLYNPITGRKMVKTWRANALFDGLENSYKILEKLLDNRFLFPKPIYRPFAAPADQNDWEGKLDDNAISDFVEDIKRESVGIQHIADPNGGILLRSCGYVDIPTLLRGYKDYLINKGVYVEEVFDYSEMKMESETVQYKNWVAKKVIFCEGPFLSNPYWKELPFRPVRGEVMDITCDLKTDFIINQGVFMIPKENHYTVGSTYDHKTLTFEPQEEGIKNLEQRLSKIYCGSYRIIQKRAGVRPATHDRKPYIGFHKKFGTIGIFNGFGTKGVSLSPYFASHFADVLVEAKELDKEVDVERVL
ncbi:MAG: FAD-dependent oxidoreductase [Ekhidna sp.]